MISCQRATMLGCWLPRNIAANADACGHRARGEVLWWGSEVGDALLPCDVVMGCEVIYQHDADTSLVSHHYCRRRKRLRMPKNLWGNSFSEIVHMFVLICPWSKSIAEICIFLCLERGLAELHVISGSRGNESSAKRAIKLHKWLPGELIKQ